MPERLLRWRPGRNAALLALLGLPLLGAIVGAALKPSPALHSEAEATLAVDLGAPGIEGDATRREARLRLIADAADSAQVLAAVNDDLDGGPSVDELEDRVDAADRLDAGTVVITVQGHNDREAAAYANLVALETLDFLQRAIPEGPGGGLPVGDFEQELEGWAAGSRFSLRPESFARDRDVRRYNGASLRVRCGPAPSCGPATTVGNPFRRGRTYAATAWVRATSPIRLTMVLGASPSDVATGPQHVARTRWRRFSVTWSPRRDYPRAEVGIQSREPGRVAINVDGVLLLEGPAATGQPEPGLSREAEAATLTDMPYAGLVSARATGEVENSTAKAALIGGLAGLLSALVAIACGLLARRYGSQ